MSKTLLLADDSVTIQKVVGISFASEDVVLIAVDNGDDAIAKAREERPDVILADVVMPGKNGYEVCEAIKADPALAHIPVLLLTGTFEAFDAERAERVGAAGHIAKPFESQTLVDLVTSLFAAAPAPAVAAGTNPADEPVAIDAAQIAPEIAKSPITDASNLLDADSFDFFDDDLGADVVAEPEPLDDAESLDFSTDSPFEFGKAELAPTADPLVTPTEPVGAAGDSERAVAATTETPIAVVPSPGAEFESIEVGRDDAFAADSSEDDLDLGSDLDLDSDLDDDDDDDDLSLDSKLEIDSDLRQPISVASESNASITFDDPPAPEDSLAPAESTGGGEGPFDFAFEPTSPEQPDPSTLIDAGSPPIDRDDLAQATTLYPENASDFDVSSSDLGPVAVNESDTTVLLDVEQPENDSDEVLQPEPNGDPILESPDVVSDDISEGIEAEAVVSAEYADDPDAGSLAETDPVELVATEVAEPSESVQPTFEPTSEPTSEPSAIESSNHPADSETDSSSGPSLDSLSETALRAEAVLERIEPRLRGQLHDTLEKIAWESFGDLTEAIVRQSVEKVEQIAWEVVPQLVEALVLEEIRKMKGEPPSDD